MRLATLLAFLSVAIGASAQPAAQVSPQVFLFGSKALRVPWATLPGISLRSLLPSIGQAHEVRLPQSSLPQAGVIRAWQPATKAPKRRIGSTPWVSRPLSSNIA